MLNWVLKGSSHEGRAADPPACRDQLSVRYGLVQASWQWNTPIKFGKEVSSSARQGVLLEKIRRKKEALLTEVDGFESGDKAALNAPHVDRAEGIALLLDMEFGQPVMTMQN
jgi:hypothetical protein